MSNDIEWWFAIDVRRPDGKEYTEEADGIDALYEYLQSFKERDFEILDIEVRKV